LIFWLTRFGDHEITETAEAFRGSASLEAVRAGESSVFPLVGVRARP
jgi:hypothetical protein